MIISFKWTIEPLLAGKKTCTRRDWSDRTMRNWQRTWDRGNKVHQAYDKLPYAGGRQIGIITLTERPYWQKLSEMPDQDAAAEGELWTDAREFIEWLGGKPDRQVAVVRFQFTRLEFVLQEQAS